MVSTVFYSDTVTNLRLSPSVLSSCHHSSMQLDFFSLLSGFGIFKSMNSLKPVLGVSAETHENQAIISYLLDRGVESEEFRLLLN